MQYLLLANRQTTPNGFDFDCSLTERNLFNIGLYNLLVEQTASLPDITTSNYNVINNGKLIIDNINSAEPLLRLLGFRRCDYCGAWVTHKIVEAMLLSTPTAEENVLFA